MFLVDCSLGAPKLSNEFFFERSPGGTSLWARGHNFLGNLAEVEMKVLDLFFDQWPPKLYFHRRT